MVLLIVPAIGRDMHTIKFLCNSTSAGNYPADRWYNTTLCGFNCLLEKF